MKSHVLINRKNILNKRLFIIPLTSYSLPAFRFGRLLGEDSKQAEYR